ncbi:unnamed protein product, partial [Amoebophrya sp. A120]|eukprot:GSA120T00025823001.1
MSPVKRKTLPATSIMANSTCCFSMPIEHVVQRISSLSPTMILLVLFLSLFQYPDYVFLHFHAGTGVVVFAAQLPRGSQPQNLRNLGTTEAGPASWQHLPQVAWQQVEHDQSSVGQGQQQAAWQQQHQQQQMASPSVLQHTTGLHSGGQAAGGRHQPFQQVVPGAAPTGASGLMTGTTSELYQTTRGFSTGAQQLPSRGGGV